MVATRPNTIASITTTQMMAAIQRCFFRFNMGTPFHLCRSVTNGHLRKYAPECEIIMVIPVVIIIFVIFIAWTQYEMKKSSKEARKAEDAFWAREEQANFAPKQDISDLPLLHFEESVIPLPPDGTFTPEDDITTYIKELQALLREPMIDLSEYTNTDLKLAYGVANFTTLSGYDDNYNSFLLLMTNLARGYERREMYELAARTYRSALSCGSLKLTDYTGLAKVYLAMDKPEKVSELIEEVESSENPRSGGIVEALKRELAKYQ